MYILKSGLQYFNGRAFVDSQRAAKRFDMDRPTPTLVDYLDFLFDGSYVRFVKLTPQRTRGYAHAADDAIDDGWI